MQIKVSNGLSPLLRKPFGFHRIVGNHKKQIIEILYESIGKGTRALSARKPGEALDIIGPLGNGFNLERQGASILVAGGIGAAPLLMLAEELVRNRKLKIGKNILVLLGARSKNDILGEKEFKKAGCKVKIVTDDGSKGHKGFVSALLQKILTTNDKRPTTIYACGPKAMLKEVAGIAGKNKIPCQLLLEEYMACGVGVCLGCAVMTKSGYKMVCKDGPVFEASEVIWE